MPCNHRPIPPIAGKASMRCNAVTSSRSFKRQKDKSRVQVAPQRYSSSNQVRFDHACRNWGLEEKTDKPHLQNPFLIKPQKYTQNNDCSPRNIAVPHYIVVACLLQPLRSFPLHPHNSLIILKINLSDFQTVIPAWLLRILMASKKPKFKALSTQVVRFTVSR